MSAPTGRLTPQLFLWLSPFVARVPTEVRGQRRVGVNLIAAFCALSFFWHDAHIVRMEAVLFGSLFATFLYAPMQKIRIAARFVSALAPLVWVVGIVAFFNIVGKSATPSQLVTAFVAGAVFFASFIVIDRLRAISRATNEGLRAD
jgi:hypothetical protein